MLISNIIIIFIVFINRTTYIKARKDHVRNTEVLLKGSFFGFASMVLSALIISGLSEQLSIFAFKNGFLLEVVVAIGLAISGGYIGIKTSYGPYDKVLYNIGISFVSTLVLIWYSLDSFSITPWAVTLLIITISNCIHFIIRNKEKYA